MKRLLCASAESSLAISNRHDAGNHASSLDYIPGTTLRGATAATYLQTPSLQQKVNKALRKYKQSFEDYFRWVFLSEDVCFPNLYPSQGSDSPVSLPIPLSARTCKRFPGFTSGSEALFSPRHGIFDILLNEPMNFRCNHMTGNVPCMAPVVPYSGFYEGPLPDLDQCYDIHPSRRILARTAIENPTETAQQGALYTLEVLEERHRNAVSKYTGMLTLDRPAGLESPCQDVYVKLLLKHLDDPEFQLAVGRAKTRGLGTIQLDVLGDLSSPLLPALEERFKGLQESWQHLNPNAPSTWAFTLTLNADAIILDDLWRYTSVLHDTILAQYHPESITYQLKRYFTGTRVVSGWHAAHGMPKEDALAILKGAAFLYVTSDPPERLLPWLQELETYGIGERRHEGFGQVVACHPFHWKGVAV